MKAVQFEPVIAYCLDIHDLLVSKLATGRLKDLEFTGAILHLRLATRGVLRKRIALLDSERDRAEVQARITAVLNDLSSCKK